MFGVERSLVCTYIIHRNMALCTGTSGYRKDGAGDSSDVCSANSDVCTASSYVCTASSAVFTASSDVCR